MKELLTSKPSTLARPAISGASFVCVLAFLFIGAQSAGAASPKNSPVKPYVKSTPDFNLICNVPCVWRRFRINDLFEIVKKDFKAMENELGAKVPAELKPINIHLGARKGGFAGKECLKSAEKYKSTDIFVDRKSNGKAIICTRANPLRVLRRNGNIFQNISLADIAQTEQVKQPKSAAAQPEQKVSASVPTNATASPANATAPVANAAASVLNKEVPDAKLTITSGNIMLVCEEECLKFEKNVMTFLDALSVSKDTLDEVERNFQTPVFPFYKPVEIHIGFDATCRKIAPPSYMQPATMKIAFMYIKEDVGGSIVCLNGNLRDVTEGFSPLVHEFTHLYFYVHRYPEEENIEELLVGTINGYSPKTKYSEGSTLCDAAIPKSNFAEFCKKYNLEYAKIPLFIQRLVERRKSGVLTNAILREELANLNNR